jgi:2-polyprenyl-3-methyl-5-hydroxy-6-metoxy-1,4-benzoquinol methylase
VTAVTRSADGIVTGNTYDKYNSRNPVVRRLMAASSATWTTCSAAPSRSSVLDIGCGEGVLTHRWASELAPRRVVGVDLDDPLLAAEWAQRPRRT